MSGSIRHDSRRAVSPVLGVVLLIAITVLLAATIATMVFGIGLQPTVAPQVDWQFTYDGSGNLTISHAGGDTVDGTSVRLAGDPVPEPMRLEDLSPGPWTTGTSGTLTIDAEEDHGTVVLVWEGDDGYSTILTEWGPPVS